VDHLGGDDVGVVVVLLCARQEPSLSPLLQDGSDDGSHAAHATTEKPKVSTIPLLTRFLVRTVTWVAMTSA
jgi:hypothetical protein